MFKSVWCEKDGMKKGPWTPEEDQKLSAYIEAHGHGSWTALPAKAGLSRCGKSCRLRWNNYLRPDIKRGKFSLQEEQSIIQLHALLGNRWSAIASHLPKRTDNEIKNYWNTHLRKRLHKAGIDPVTHKPKVDVFGSSSGHSKDAANLSHLAQWERTRLEAEARLVRESKLVSNSLQNQVGSSAITKVVAPAPARPQCLDVLKAWEAIVSGKFFSAGNSLESPCSTLNFSDNTLPIPAIGFHENSTGMLEFANDNDNLTCKRSQMTGHKDQLCNGGNDWNCLEKLIGQISQLKEKLENPEVVQLHEMSTYSNTDNNAWLVDSFRGSAAPAENVNAPIGHIIDEGLSDILICNSDEQNSLVAAGGGASGGENGNGSCGGVNLDQEIMNYCNSLVNLVEDKASGSYVVLTDHHHDM